MAYRDPWANVNAWKKNPVFSYRYQLKNAFPGFGIAAVAFTAYVLYDNYFSQSSKPTHKVESSSHH